MKKSTFVKLAKKRLASLAKNTGGDPTFWLALKRGEQNALSWVAMEMFIETHDRGWRKLANWIGEHK